MELVHRGWVPRGMGASPPGHGAVSAPYLGTHSLGDMQKVLLSHSVAPGPVWLVKEGPTLVMSPVGLVGCVCVMTQAQQAAAWWVLLHPPEPSGCVGACHPRRVPGATRALAQGKEGLQRVVKKQRLRDRFGCCVSLGLGVSSPHGCVRRDRGGMASYSSIIL